jgi:hypothetical protein
MAEYAEIKRIELRRLAELEKVRALEGPGTDPAILIEIADLRTKYGADAVAVSADAGGPERRLWNEIDFLRAMLSAALREFASDKEARQPRQFWMTVWMVSLTVAGLMNLYFVWIIAQAVFRR